MSRPFSMIEEELAELLHADIKNFILRNHPNSVLIFPPFNRYYRFMTHETCRQFWKKYRFVTFSVGNETVRRTILCHVNQIKRPSNTRCSNALNRRDRSDQWALRPTTTSKEDWASGDNRLNTKKRTQRNQSFGWRSSYTATQSFYDKSPPMNVRQSKKCMMDNNTTETLSVVGNSGESQMDACPSAAATKTSASYRRRPDRELYVPRPRRNQIGDTHQQQQEQIQSANVDDKWSPTTVTNMKLRGGKSRYAANNKRATKSTLQRSNTDNNGKNNTDEECIAVEAAMRRLNLNCGKTTMETFVQNEDTSCNGENAICDSRGDATAGAAAATADAAETEVDLDDWEYKYNDEGECLDKSILKDIYASLGKVKIEFSEMNYDMFVTKQQEALNDEEFPYVLEVSQFPTEFTNKDLFMVFSSYRESGFDIKWVEDTRALIIFSSAEIAAEALAKTHPLVVVKPLAEASAQSRLKAKSCPEALQPYRSRPETCAALARRLVTGALGVRLKTSTAQQEYEKRILQEAKERKEAAKQRSDGWDN